MSPWCCAKGAVRSLRWAWVEGANDTSSKAAQTLRSRSAREVIFQAQAHRFGQAGAESGVQQQGFFARV